jgi:hypothetical protein
MIEITLFPVYDNKLSDSTFSLPAEKLPASEGSPCSVLSDGKNYVGCLYFIILLISSETESFIEQ